MLNVSNNFAGNIGATRIASALPLLSRVTELHLHTNAFDAAGAQASAGVLSWLGLDDSSYRRPVEWLHQEYSEAKRHRGRAEYDGVGVHGDSSLLLAPLTRSAKRRGDRAGVHHPEECPCPTSNSVCKTAEEWNQRSFAGSAALVITRSGGTEITGTWRCVGGASVRLRQVLQETLSNRFPLLCDFALAS